MTSIVRSGRRRLRRLIGPVVYGALIGVLTPLHYGQTFLLRARSRGRKGTTRQIPRVAATEVELDALMKAGQPVVIEGLGSSVDTNRYPDLATLRSIAGQYTETFPVDVHDPTAPYFLYTGDYGLVVDHTEQLTLDQLLDRLFTDGDDRSAIYHQFASGSLAGATDEILQDMADHLADVVDLAPEPSASGVWIGSPGVVTPLHYDVWPGLLFPTHADKAVTMFAPDDAPNLYLESPFAVGGRWSHLPGLSAEADPESFDRLARTTTHQATLHAGDALFIPPFWAHEMQALEANISMPFRFSVQPTSYLNPRSLRALVEVFHRDYLRKRRR
ncbi:MAG: cupin-like domain-containing protein [Acidimicrobiales bacterium]